MAKTTKETSDRAKKWKCVRFDDKKGLVTKLNKNIEGEVNRNAYHFSVKYVEQLARGCSPTSVAEEEEFQEFREVPEGLKCKALPEDYQSFSPTMKIETVKKLSEEIFNELAPAVSHRLDQGVDSQADSSDNSQVGNARQLDMTDKEDVDMQVNNPGQIQADEVPAAAPNPDLGNTFSNDASLQNVAWNQCENPEGRPPSRPPVSRAVHAFIFSDLKHRALRWPEILLEFQALEEALGSSVGKLELLEGACEDHSKVFSRSRQDELFAKLEDFPACENVSTTPMDENLEDEEFCNNFLTFPEA